jgi:THO complex subunit 2
MVTERLRSESESWFTCKSTQKNDTMTIFLQMCVYQRACFTAQDALFCARFVLLLHQLKTPNFPTLICYDRVRMSVRSNHVEAKVKHKERFVIIETFVCIV